MIKTKTIYIFLPFFLFFLISCSLPEEDHSARILKENFSKEVWFKQTAVDLGGRIQIISPDLGMAISRGKGEEVKGKLLLFKNGIWEAVDQFDYSDYPQLAIAGSGIFLYVIHETHKGFYKPRMFSYSENSRKEILLPPVMWDDRDYAMWQSLFVLPSGKAFMVGQQGNILHYNGFNWSEEYSPVKRKEGDNLLSGDLHDIYMLSDTLGWAVGKNGIILKHINGSWQKYLSPVDVDLRSISMLNENFGWIVGERGTILNYINQKWQVYSTEHRFTFNSVKVVDFNKAWIVGSRSTLLEYNGSEWIENTAVKIFDDIFRDIDVVADGNDDYKIWIIGNNGIYSNSQNLKFSFTNITSQASVRKDGRAAIFQDINKNGLTDLALLLEDGPSLFYENMGNNLFVESTVMENQKSAQTTAIGDINNDGFPDILTILDDINYSLIFGKGGFNFRNVNVEEYLKLDIIEPDLELTSAQFADFNNDGNLDLYISNHNDNDMLFKNDGAGRFTNVYSGSGITKFLNHRSYGATLSDFNNDGQIDILITYKVPNNKQHISLFINKGAFKFENKIDSNFLIGSAPSTLSSIANDFNNDGFTDLIVFNNEEKIKFLVNNGDASFVDVTDSVGLDEKFFHPEPSNGILAAADVNNDGWLDLFIGSRLYLNSPEFKFYEIGKHIGIDFSGNPSFVDIDNDGDVDLFVGSSRTSFGGGDRAVLYRNNMIDKNFIKVNLKPDKSNRSGIGAKVYLEAYDSNGNMKYKTLRQAGLGASAIAQGNYSTIHFGIDPKLKYKLRVIFPSGIEKKYDNILNRSIINVNESQFPYRQLILAGKSLNRTFLLFHWPAEIVKILFMFFVLGLLYRYGIKTKAKSIIKKWYLASTFFIIYFLLVHVNITNGIIVSSIISIGFTGITALVFIFFSAAYIEKKESKFVSHFKIIDILGVGGMGKVFKAIDVNNGKTVAVKVINPQLLKEEENQKRLASEGRLLSSLNHPNIIKVYEYGEISKHTFIAMEYLSGGTLEDYIQNNFPISIDNFINISSQICAGLSEIHFNNIFHRDLKSSNIMFDEKSVVRIMDFGLSKSPLVTTMTSLGTVVGTLGYVAPEQITNIQIDQRTDIFSLGVVLYQMITNTLPFKGENEMALIHSIFNTVPIKPTEINSSFPDIFNNIIMRCIDKLPDNRYSSAKEVLRDLRNIHK